MTTGLPQDQQDLRWPYTEDDDDRPIAPPARQEHPSGPLPVARGRSTSQRGWGRGRGRDAAAEPEPEGDADYDWIRYLGAAGPAQESSRRSDARAARRGSGQPQASSGAESPGSGLAAESWRTAPARGDASTTDPWQTVPPLRGGGAPARGGAPVRDGGAPEPSSAAVTL